MEEYKNAKNISLYKIQKWKKNHFTPEIAYARPSVGR